MPKINNLIIFIPVYKRLNILFECLDGLSELKNSLSNYQIIIFNNNPDDTLSIKYFLENSSLKYIILQGCEKYYWGKSIYYFIKRIKHFKLFDSNYIFMNQDILTDVESIKKLVSSLNKDQNNLYTTLSNNSKIIDYNELIYFWNRHSNTHNKEKLEILLSGFRLIAIPGKFFKLRGFLFLKFFPHYLADYFICLLANFHNYRIKLSDVRYFNLEPPSGLVRQPFIFRYFHQKGQNYLPAFLIYNVFKTYLTLIHKFKYLK